LIRFRQLAIALEGQVAESFQSPGLPFLSLIYNWVVAHSIPIEWFSVIELEITLVSSGVDPTLVYSLLHRAVALVTV
jgi:hypothetical protein